MPALRFKLALHYQIVIALIAGVFFGYLAPDSVAYTNWIGDVFLRGLNMIVVPLIFLSITTGVASVGNGDNLGRLGLKTMGYYLLSTFLAIITGFILVNLIKPGVGAELGFKMPVENLSAISDSFGTTLIKIIPSNIFEALSQGQMLSIIFFAILLGYFITKMDQKPQQLLVDVFNAGLDAIMKITLFVIRFTPIGVFSIAAKVIAQQIQMGNQISEVFSRLGL